MNYRCYLKHQEIEAWTYYLIGNLKPLGRIKPKCGFYMDSRQSADRDEDIILLLF